MFVSDCLYQGLDQNRVQPDVTSTGCEDLVSLLCI